MISSGSCQIGINTTYGHVVRYPALKEDHRQEESLGNIRYVFDDPVDVEALGYILKRRGHLGQAE